MGTIKTFALSIFNPNSEILSYFMKTKSAFDKKSNNAVNVFQARGHFKVKKNVKAEQ